MSVWKTTYVNINTFFCMKFFSVKKINIQMNVFCCNCLIDPCLLSIHFYNNDGTFYRKFLDTLKKYDKTLSRGSCSCSLCISKRVSTWLWFIHVVFDLYVVCYGFLDTYVKNFSVSVYVEGCDNINYMVNDFLCCINFYTKNDSLMSLNGFCQMCKL